MTFKYLFIQIYLLITQILLHSLHQQVLLSLPINLKTEKEIYSSALLTDRSTLLSNNLLLIVHICYFMTYSQSSVTHWCSTLQREGKNEMLKEWKVLFTNSQYKGPHTRRYTYSSKEDIRNLQIEQEKKQWLLRMLHTPQRHFFILIMFVWRVLLTLMWNDQTWSHLEDSHTTLKGSFFL